MSKHKLLFVRKKKNSKKSGGAPSGSLSSLPETPWAVLLFPKSPQNPRDKPDSPTVVSVRRVLFYSWFGSVADKAPHRPWSQTISLIYPFLANKGINLSHTILFINQPSIDYWFLALPLFLLSAGTFQTLSRISWLLQHPPSAINFYFQISGSLWFSLLELVNVGSSKFLV